MCNIGISNKNKSVSIKQNFLYTRVSTKKQMDDLSRQLEYIKKPQYVNYTVIQDIGSGINFKRKGLSKILDACIQGTIGEVVVAEVVAHKDRLSRFGFELIEQFVEKGGGKITILESKGNNKSTEQELSEDLLSIIHIFNCKQMGKRSYSTKVKNTKNQIEANSITEICT